MSWKKRNYANIYKKSLGVQKRNEKEVETVREEAELHQLILSVGQRVGARAIGLSGSRTDPQAPKDFLQDFDVVYVMDDIQPLVDDPSWLEAFGPIMIRQTPEASTIYPPSLGGCFTYLMHFLDGVRIDLMLCPLALVDRLANEPGLQPLLDPGQILSFAKQANHSHYWIKRPTQAAFQEHCNEFWWVSTYVVKGLLRKQLIYAADHLYTICWQELLWIEDLFVAQAQQFQVSTGKNHKYLQSFLTEKEWRELTSLLDFSTITACGQSLLKMQKRFDGQAKNISEKLGLAYDWQEAENVQTYTKYWSEKNWQMEPENQK